MVGFALGDLLRFCRFVTVDSSFSVLSLDYCFFSSFFFYLISCKHKTTFFGVIILKYKSFACTTWTLTYLSLMFLSTVCLLLFFIAFIIDCHITPLTCTNLNKYTGCELRLSFNYELVGLIINYREMCLFQQCCFGHVFCYYFLLNETLM